MNETADLLASVKVKCGGMLPPPVYERLFQLAGRVEHGPIVEIGTAQGAAAIVLARGARAAGRSTAVLTSDPFDRGSRLGVGSVACNLALVKQGLAEFGVADRVQVVAGTAADLIAQADPQRIGLVLIDADGAIDRDLALLFDRLAPDAVVAIDDVDGEVHAHPAPGGWTIDQKHRLTRLLCDALCARDVLRHEATICATGFYRKGAARLSPEEWSALALDAYRQLVFAPIARSRIGSLARVRRAAVARFPRLASLVRRLRGGAG